MGLALTCCVARQGSELQAYAPRRAQLRETKSLASMAAPEAYITPNHFAGMLEANRTSPRHSPPDPGPYSAHRMSDDDVGPFAALPGSNGALPASFQPERTQDPRQKPHSTVGEC